MRFSDVDCVTESAIISSCQLEVARDKEERLRLEEEEKLRKEEETHLQKEGGLAGSQRVKNRKSLFGVHALRFSDVDCVTESAIISSCQLEVARDKEERLRLEEEEKLRKEEETHLQKEGGLAGSQRVKNRKSLFGVHALRFSDVDCVTESAIISSCQLEVARDKEERLRLEEEEKLRKEEETHLQKEGGLAGSQRVKNRKSLFGVHALRFSDVDCVTESAIISSCRLEVARDKEERLRLEEEEKLRKEEETHLQKEGGLAGPENLCIVTMLCLWELVDQPREKIRGPTSNSCEVGGPDAIFS